MHNALVMENSALESGTLEANTFDNSLSNGPELWTDFLPEFVRYHGPATAHKEQTIPKHGGMARQAWTEYNNAQQLKPAFDVRVLSNRNSCTEPIHF